MILKGPGTFWGVDLLLDLLIFSQISQTERRGGWFTWREPSLSSTKVLLLLLLLLLLVLTRLS